MCKKIRHFCLYILIQIRYNIINKFIYRMEGIFMQINAELGKVFDVVFFTSHYYDPSSLEDACRANGISPELFTAPFKEVREQVEPISSLFLPLVAQDDMKKTVLAYLLEEFIVRESITFNEYLSLFDEGDLLFGKLVYTLFRGKDEDTRNALTARDLPTWYKVCGESSLPNELAVSLMYFAAQYRVVLPEIKRDLRKIYTAVSNYHKLHQDMVDKTLAILGERESLEAVVKNITPDATPKDADRLTVSVALMNPLMTFWHKAESDNRLICGPEFALGYDLHQVPPAATIADFAISCGSRHRMEILYKFREHGMLTAAQIARLMGFSAPMAWRYVEMLHQNKVLYISRQEAKNIYYSLNPEFFKSVRRSLDDFMTYFE